MFTGAGAVVEAMERGLRETSRETAELYVRAPGAFGMRSDVEDLADVVPQDPLAEGHGLRLGQPAGADEVVGQGIGQDAAVHVVLRQHELQLVRVRVVPDLLGFGNGL